jgi:hypothetical protein
MVFAAALGAGAGCTGTAGPLAAALPATGLPQYGHLALGSFDPDQFCGSESRQFGHFVGFIASSLRAANTSKAARPPEADMPRVAAQRRVAVRPQVVDMPRAAAQPRVVVRLRVADMPKVAKWPRAADTPKAAQRQWAVQPRAAG